VTFPTVRQVIQDALLARAFPAAVVEVGRADHVLLQEAFGRLSWSSDAAAVGRLLPATKVTLEYRPDRPLVFVDGRDGTDAIRTPEISQLASLVSAIPAVREWLLPVQRDIGAAGGIVAEGRDLGTRIFPQAQAKFFLDADVSTRATRRQKDLAAAGESTALAQTKQEIEARDERDRSRALAPLVPAADAERIDSSSLTVEQVLERMLATIATKL